jgi:integrase
MKGGREHRVPLSEPALAIILKKLHEAKHGEYVFPQVALEHGPSYSVAANEAQSHNRARVPFDLQGLGDGMHELS